MKVIYNESQILTLITNALVPMDTYTMYFIFLNIVVIKDRMYNGGLGGGHTKNWGRKNDFMPKNTKYFMQILWKVT